MMKRKRREGERESKRVEECNECLIWMFQSRGIEVVGCRVLPELKEWIETRGNLRGTINSKREETCQFQSQLER